MKIYADILQSNSKLPTILSLNQINNPYLNQFYQLQLGFKAYKLKQYQPRLSLLPSQTRSQGYIQQLLYKNSINLDLL